jgi:hypothetical protein
MSIVKAISQLFREPPTIIKAYLRFIADWIIGRREKIAQAIGNTLDRIEIGKDVADK